MVTGRYLTVFHNVAGIAFQVKMSEYILDQLLNLIYYHAYIEKWQPSCQ